MKIFKRWTASVVTSFDNIIGQVENHEAVVAASIKEAQEATTKAQVRLKRLQRDKVNMDNRLTKLRQSHEAWTQRALQVKDVDKEKALECLRRRETVSAEITSLEDELKKHTQLESQLTRDIESIAQRVRELKRRKNEFSAREYRAKAIESSQFDNEELSNELETVFERWEVKLSQSEAYAEPAFDNFEDSFIKDEERAALEQALDELTEEENNKES